MEKMAGYSPGQVCLLPGQGGRGRKLEWRDWEPLATGGGRKDCGREPFASNGYMMQNMHHAKQRKVRLDRLKALCWRLSRAMGSVEFPRWQGPREKCKKWCEPIRNEREETSKERIIPLSCLYFLAQSANKRVLYTVLVGRMRGNLDMMMFETLKCCHLLLIWSSTDV